MVSSENVEGIEMEFCAIVAAKFDSLDEYEAWLKKREPNEVVVCDFFGSVGTITNVAFSVTSDVDKGKGHKWIGETVKSGMLYKKNDSKFRDRFDVKEKGEGNSYG